MQTYPITAGHLIRWLELKYILKEISNADLLYNIET